MCFQVMAEAKGLIMLPHFETENKYKTSKNTRPGLWMSRSRRPLAAGQGVSSFNMIGLLHVRWIQALIELMEEM